MYRKILTVIFITAVMILTGCGKKHVNYPGFIPDEYQGRLGKVVYANNFDGRNPLTGLVMEGPGRMVVEDGALVMDSPDMAGHFTNWINLPIPGNFMMRFDFRLQCDDGLCSLFICAMGKDGISIFDPFLKKREGNFAEYIDGDINNYLLQYYTQNPTHLDDTHNEVRKNAGFELMQKSPTVIDRGSTKQYRVTVIKDYGRILMLIDDDVLFDIVDNNVLDRAPYGNGYIGFRQMKWTKASYDNVVIRKLN